MESMPTCWNAISIKAFLCVNVEIALLLEKTGVKDQHCFFPESAVSVLHSTKLSIRSFTEDLIIFNT